MQEAERLRIVYQLITHPESEGGAGITPKEGEWENVESIFALHDNAYNKEWIKTWSTKWILTPEDLDDIRNRLGEKVRINAQLSLHQTDHHRSLSTLHTPNPTLPFLQSLQPSELRRGFYCLTSPHCTQLPVLSGASSLSSTGSTRSTIWQSAGASTACPRSTRSARLSDMSTRPRTLSLARPFRSSLRPSGCKDNSSKSLLLLQRPSCWAA